MSEPEEEKVSSDAMERLQTVFDVIATPAGEDLRGIFNGMTALSEALYEEDVPRTPMLVKAVMQMREAIIDAIMGEIGRTSDDKSMLIGVLQDVLRRD